LIIDLLVDQRPTISKRVHFASGESSAEGQTNSKFSGRKPFEVRDQIKNVRINPLVFVNLLICAIRLIEKINLSTTSERSAICDARQCQRLFRLSLSHFLDVGAK
jgi:hypothetical protein